MISHWKNKPIIINSRTLIMLKMKNIIIMSLIHIPMRKRVNLIAKSINMIISMTKKSIPMVMRKKTIIEIGKIKRYFFIYPVYNVSL